MFKLQNVTDPEHKLQVIIDLLTTDLPKSTGALDYNTQFLNQIIISESSKVYLVKDVEEINKAQVFKPYKDLCGRIAQVISEYNPEYQYPRSLSSTLIETSHFQQFFSSFLPRLTDNKDADQSAFTTNFLTDLIFKAIGMRK